MSHDAFACTALATSIATMRAVGCNSSALHTDKIDSSGYQLMYGMHLMPLQHAAHTPRILEIGLGCNMQYGAGRSAKLWRTLLPRATLWEADIDATCIYSQATKLRQEGINAVAGSQGKAATVSRWIAQSGGNFDAIIDDGSHVSSDVFVSFPLLWQVLKPGGVYFIEDIGGERMRDLSLLLESWMHAELHLAPCWRPETCLRTANLPHDDWMHMPRDIAFINGFDGAVAIGKDARQLGAQHGDRQIATGRGTQCNGDTRRRRPIPGKRGKFELVTDDAKPDEPGTPWERQG